MKRIHSTLLTVLMAVIGVCSVLAQEIKSIIIPVPGEKITLHQGWVTRRANDIVIDGNRLTSRPVATDGWMPATVPGTVLTTMLNNKLIPDPMFSMNNESIPDIYHVGNDYYTFWFLNQFRSPKRPDGKRVWLNFRGINYRADIFMNGKRVNPSTHEGMFLRQSYEITPYLKSGDSLNVLAVIVWPPTHPGNPNGGQGGDAQIARNNTMQYTPGWDWIQPVRDRNTGIWDEVSITATGDVRMMHPFVTTRVPGVRQVQGTQKEAYVHTSVELSNQAYVPQSGTVVCTTQGQITRLKVTLQPKETRQVDLQTIAVKNPKLWWPNGVGEQPLSDIRIEFITDNGQISDAQVLRYGIRELTTDKDPETGGRRFWVNGQKIYMTGGNYINSDWMLRLSPERYDSEVRFHKEMNIRMIRVWGGALTERPEFYDACDKYGILVFQDLWTTGDCNGAWVDPTKLDSPERRREYPDDHDLYLRSAEDQIKMSRTRTSLALWCGGNEWPSARDIDERLRYDLIPRLDPLRTFASFSTDTVFTRNTQGGVGDGPYGIQEPEWFFTTNASPFNPEAGSVGSPEVESMRLYMTEEELSQGIISMQRQGPRRQMAPAWIYHKDLGYGDHLTRYGDIKDIETYCKYAQVVNYDQYRSFMEGWASQMWDKYTGILIWKTQNPWTSLRGQMYDWFLDINASLSGTQKGCETLHPQYNLASKQVELPNTGLTSYSNLSVKASLYDRSGKQIWNKEQNGIHSAANSVNRLFAVDKPTDVEGVYFLKLSLLDSTGRELTDNIYWLTTKEKDYTTLAGMPKVKPIVKVDRVKEGESHRYTIDLSVSEGISFFNRLKVFDKNTGARILPAHYSENYITLMPGDAKQVVVEFNSSLAPSDVRVVVQSWTADDIDI